MQPYHAIALYLRATQSLSTKLRTDYIARYLPLNLTQISAKHPQTTATLLFLLPSIAPDSLLVRTFHAMRDDSAASCCYKIFSNCAAYSCVRLFEKEKSVKTKNKLEQQRLGKIYGLV